MNLAQIREQFVKRCGRYDLIKEDGSDDGADFFIQSGVRFLDRRSNVGGVRNGTSLVGVSRGGVVPLPQCWLVKDVFIYGPHGWRPLINTASSKALCVRFTSDSTPHYYTTLLQRTTPKFSMLSAADMRVSAAVCATPEMSPGILHLEVLPHPTQDASLEVHGNFYSDPLHSNEDVNIWSEQYPDTLIKAALYQLEIFYRNTEGANDWLTSIQIDLTDIEQLEVLSEIHGKDVMGL